VSEPVLALSDIVVAFGALRAVDGITLSVAAGERRAVIGPNGAGKTTLFNALTGVITPTAGRILFEGHDITRTPPHRRARAGIGRTFQITNLFPTLTVQENLTLALRGQSARKFSLFGDCALDATEEAQAAQALSLSRLAGRRSRPVKELSYGEQRQLELALAVVGKPRLLLLDEPGAGLSPGERSIVADIIRALPRELTVLLIEHDMELALGIVDYVTCMHEGRVLVEGVPADIRGNARVQEVYLGKPRHA
jgi:branched-chain amino acid transport system ATP-binding protein